MFSFRTTPLEDQLDKALMDGKVGCFCTQNCWDTSSDRYMYQIFKERGNLERLFQPEDAELTPGTNHIHFDSESLKGLSAVVVEIQDTGSRYFNYTRDVFRLMMLMMVLDEAPALYIVNHINPADSSASLECRLFSFFVNVFLLLAEHDLMAVYLIRDGQAAENSVEDEFNALVLRIDAYQRIFVREHVTVEEAVLAFVLQCSKGFRKRNVLE